MTMRQRLKLTAPRYLELDVAADVDAVDRGDDRGGAGSGEGRERQHTGVGWSSEREGAITGGVISDLGAGTRGGRKVCAFTVGSLLIGPFSDEVIAGDGAGG